MAIYHTRQITQYKALLVVPTTVLSLLLPPPLAQVLLLDDFLMKKRIPTDLYCISWYSCRFFFTDLIELPFQPAFIFAINLMIQAPHY